ncbi:MAG: endonuclease NucS domain-containing protein [Methanoregula sp.]|jgi:CRISPR/Cas system-associated exonuclease Cas4 (RecB family)|nr:endonuclease NucS [Methanoregula sp.]
MTVIHLRSGQSKKLSSEKIQGKSIVDKEKNLQELLANNPQLLQQNQDQPLMLVGREIKLNSGDIDILFLNSEGRIVIVEVKLAKNPEIEREIIGQVVAYASSLMLLKFEELDERTGGNLISALKRLAKTESEFKQKREYCEKTIRNGSFRLIIAVDFAPNPLLREWLYQSAHTKLELRLFTIQKYSINADEEILVSNVLVSQESYRIRNPKESSTAIIQVTDSYSSLQSKTPSQTLKKSGPSNWAVFIRSWPKDIHYEFNYWEQQNQISVEIQVKLKSYGNIKDFIHSLKETLHETLEGQVKLCPDWNGWARLAFLYSADLLPAEIAQKMVELIDGSYKLIEDKLKN